MAALGERFMRILLFFDLPTLSKSDRRVASQFRHSLIKDGYHMLQLSVYARICKGVENAEAHIRRLRNFSPTTGSIRVLLVTEKQYEDMLIIIGNKKKVEELDDRQLCFF